MRELREAYGLSQSEVDLILRLKKGTCCRWESHNTTPQHVLMLLAFVLKEVK